MQFISTQKLIINIWKIMIKIKNHHLLIIKMEIIYMDGQYRKRNLLKEIYHGLVLKKVHRLIKFDKKNG